MAQNWDYSDDELLDMALNGDDIGSYFDGDITDLIG